MRIGEKYKVNKEKAKQVALVGIAILLIGIGLINFDGDESNSEIEVAVVENENTIGDVVLVSSNAVVENDTSAIVENDELSGNTLTNVSTDTNSVTSESTDDYFEATRLERDTMYSKMLDEYQKILDNESIEETQKAIAVQEITNINNNQNAIMISENLIKNKGYTDVVVLVNEIAISVVVKSAYLSSEDISKIQNIVQREFSADAENISITSRQ